jgi:hypothetical protein
MKKNKITLKLETFDWNKLTKKEQDKSLIFMYGVLGQLSEKRKYGIDNRFWAETYKNK